MRLTRRLVAMACIVVAALASACGGGGGDAEPTPAAATGGPPGTHFGMAGLIPRNFPNASDDDWRDLWASFADTGGAMGVYTNWADSPATAGQVPSAVDAAFAAATQYRLTPVVALGISRDADGRVVSTVDWGNQAQRQAFVATAVAVAAKHHPAYLALGVEVNRLWETDPEAFDRFVEVYKEAYAAIKRVSPGTQVFTIFQLEMVKGAAPLAGGGESRKPEWPVLHRFHGKLDLAGFTTYPFLAYQSPGDIPANYYATAAAETGVPIAVTEIGWPSAPLANAPGSAYGGTPDEQAEFARRLPELIAGVDVRLALWAFPHDVGPGAGPAFASVGLRENNGTAKPALAAWREVAGAR